MRVLCGTVLVAAALSLISGAPARAALPCVTGSAQAGTLTYPGDLAEWMSCMYPRGSGDEWTQQLGTITMPGSHNAGTHALYSSEATAFDYATRCSSPVDLVAQGAKWVSRQWAMTQTLALSGQAAVGSRWFDLTGIWDHGEWRACSGLVTDRWDRIVSDLVSFHGDHPDEVLVIDVSRMFDALDDTNTVALATALAPMCRDAVAQTAAPTASGDPSRITIHQARAAGGFVIQMTDAPSDFRGYAQFTAWLGAHREDPCAGRIWSREATSTHRDPRPNANLWVNRRHPPRAAGHLIDWQARHLVNTHGSFQVAQYTWDFSGPTTRLPYQIWLMNHWLVDYNQVLARDASRLAQRLGARECAVHAHGAVVLMDNIAQPRQARRLVALNEAACP